MKKVSIIIPVYNEEKAIKITLDKLLPFASKNGWEIVVVNDGSNDNTSKIIESYNSINVIKHPYNKGYGSALKSGINRATSEWVCFFDSDNQHNPEDVEKLILNLNEYDLLIGCRDKNSFNSWLRKPGKYILSKVANILTERKIPDLNSGLRIVKRELITKYLHLFPDGFSFSTTSTIAFFCLGFNVGFHPIVVNKRIGKSSVRQVKHGLIAVMLIIRLIVLFNPLKIFMSSSIILFILSVSWEIYDGILRCNGCIKLTTTSLLLFLTSLLIFFFGLVVDQISELRKHQFDK